MDYFLFACIGTFGYLLFDAIFNLDFNDHYERGQIDAINGKIKYEKYETENGEIRWREKK